MKDIFLSEFNPKSELIVEQHEVLKPKYPAVDFHTHISLRKGQYNMADEMKDLEDYGVAAVVNLDGFWGERLDFVLEQAKQYKDRIIIFGSVDVTKIDEPDFGEYAVNIVRENYKKGIKGLKFFKDVSLKYKDIHGNYIRIDDERLKPIWKIAAELNLPVLVHIADPIAFFKPVDGINERYEQLNIRPDWSFAGEEYFKFEELIEMQKSLLENNPDTTFIIPHCGSCSEDLCFVSHQLDRFPNMYIDIAARIAELGRQPYTSRKFFINYQDRIVFGTDMFPGKRPYPYYYRFLETWDEYFDYSSEQKSGRWKIYGIGLPDDLLKKIYYMNAVKLIPSIANAIK